VRPDLEAFPWEKVTRAALVDVLHLAANLRPCARLLCVDSTAIDALRSWCGSSFVALIDPPYVFVGADERRLRDAARADASPEPHVVSLGRLFGYPECCLHAMNAVGEERIDEAARAAAGWKLTGRFRLLDVTNYLAGVALLSHVPCGPTCQPSLTMAEAAAAWILDHAPAQSDIEPWTTWLQAATL